MDNGCRMASGGCRRSCRGLYQITGVNYLFHASGNAAGLTPLTAA